MQHVICYEWPESQECLECLFGEAIPDGDCGVVCFKNHNHLAEEKCSMFEEKFPPVSEEEENNEPE